MRKPGWVGACSQIAVFNAQTDPIQAPRALRSVQHPPLLSSARWFCLYGEGQGAARALALRSISTRSDSVQNDFFRTQIRVPTEGWTPLPMAAPKLRRRPPPAVTVTAPPLYSPPPPSPPPSTCRIPKHSRRFRTRSGHCVSPLAASGNTPPDERQGSETQTRPGGHDFG